MDFMKMSFAELVKARTQIDERLKVLALQEIEAKENELNDLREYAGLKRKATSSAISKGRAKAKAASAA